MISDILPRILSELGLTVASPDISSNDTQMSQIRNLMTAAGKDICTRTQWEGCRATASIGNVSATSLPADFQEMAGTGTIDINSGGDAIYPVTDFSLWAFLTKNTPAQPYYHIAGGSVNFIPDVPAAGATMVYISRNWVSGKEEVTDNADVPVFDEDLLQRGTVCRWKREKGLACQDLMAEFEADLEAAIQADRGAN